MAKLVWDKTGERYYETGVDHGVLYLLDAEGAYSDGVVWNGLTSVSENPTGAEPNPLYADNIKYLNLMSTEEFEASIEAYTYPDEFAQCDGSAEAVAGVYVGQQPRKTFGLSYRTKIGNDIEGSDLAYKLHLVYGCLASPSEKGYETINDDPDAIQFSWDITTTPVAINGFKPTATLTFDSRKVDAQSLAALEAILYGIDANAFDASKTYAVGDYVTYQSKTYVCTTAITTAAAWDANKWEEVTATPGPRLPLPDEIVEVIFGQ